jgi:hypothetical protein
MQPGRGLQYHGVAREVRRQLPARFAALLAQARFAAGPPHPNPPPQVGREHGAPVLHDPKGEAGIRPACGGDGHESRRARDGEAHSFADFVAVSPARFHNECTDFNLGRRLVRHVLVAGNHSPVETRNIAPPRPIHVRGRRYRGDPTL